MNSVINNTGAAQERKTIRTENFADSDSLYDDDYSKYQLSLSIFWRNFVNSAPALSFWKYGAGLNYKLNEGKSSDIYTAGFAANVTFNVNATIGIVSGLEIAFLGGKVSGNFTGSYPASDAAGDDFTFSYALKNYNEQQKLTLLSIPLMMKYSTRPFSDISTKYFAALGFKVGIPLSNWSKIMPDYVTTTGFFQRELELYSDFPEQGFVNDIRGITSQSKTMFNLGIALALETGVVFLSNKNTSAGVSIYCDLGLNNMLKRDNRYLVEYQKMNPEQLRFNSIMTTENASSVNILSIGLKLSVTFNLNKK
jgi:hypothetical protein